MKAIVLSAGQGRRLMPLTERVPKCCLELDGKALLVHQVEALAANGVDEIVVVTGFNHRVVEDVVSEIDINGTSIRTLYNPFYAVSDNLGTSWVAREEMNTPFLLVNGDTLFAPSTLAQLLSSERVYPITLAVDRKGIYDEDDMKISADGEQLNRVGKDLDINIVNGESIGIMAFSRAGATAFVQTVENLMSSTDGLARWYLSAVDELAMTGMVGICSIQGHDWCEVDDLSDFTHAEKEVRNWEKRAEKPGARSSTRTEAFQRQVA